MDCLLLYTWIPTCVVMMWVMVYRVPPRPTFARFGVLLAVSHFLSGVMITSVNVVPAAIYHFPPEGKEIPQSTPPFAVLWQIVFYAGVIGTMIRLVGHDKAN